MRTKVEHHLLLSLSQHHTVSQSRETGDNLDRSSAGVVENAVLECPSVDIPHPACDRAVNKRSPEKDKNHGWD